MKLFNRLICVFYDHDWHNDTHWPVHGYFRVPYEDSYCLRCHITGARYLS